MTLPLIFLFFWFDLLTALLATGQKGSKTVRVGVFAMFDSLVGHESSEKASRVLLSKFHFNTRYIAHNRISRPFNHLVILEEALRTALREIDVEFNEASKKLLFIHLIIALSSYLYLIFTFSVSF